MHQAHNLQWNTITRHLKVEQCISYLEAWFDTSLHHNAVSTYTKGLPNEFAEMNHFLRKFVSTIREFSTIERVKYSTKPDFVSKGKVFSDGILRKYASSTSNGPWGHDSVSRDTQQIESWLQNVPRTQKSDPAGLEDAPKYAQVVKVCLNENELAPLLMLAVHPKCDLKSLYSFGQGGEYGWGELVQVALTLYIFVRGKYPSIVR